MKLTLQRYLTQGYFLRGYRAIVILTVSCMIGALLHQCFSMHDSVRWRGVMFGGVVVLWTLALMFWHFYRWLEGPKEDREMALGLTIFLTTLPLLSYLPAGTSPDEGSLLIRQGEEVWIRHQGPVWCYSYKRRCYRIPPKEAMVLDYSVRGGPNGTGKRHFFNFTIRIRVCDENKLAKAFGNQYDMRPAIMDEVTSDLSEVGKIFSRQRHLSDSREAQFNHFNQLLLEHTQPLAVKGICPLTVTNWPVE